MTTTTMMVAQSLRCRTYDQKVMSFTPGQAAIKWLMHEWVTVCEQFNHLGI